MVDESTMVGQPFFLCGRPRSSKLMSFADILSLDTKDCFSARHDGQDVGDSPPWLGTPLLRFKVRQELESIYETSLQSLVQGKLSDVIPKHPLTSTPDEGPNLLQNGYTSSPKRDHQYLIKNSPDGLTMVPKRSSPAAPTRRQPAPAPACGFAEHRLFSRLESQKGSQENLFNFFSKCEADERNMPSQKIRAQRSSCSNSSSQKDVKIDQNIDLDFNLVENYALENNTNSIGSESKTSRSALCNNGCCARDNLKINLVDVNTVSHNYISETTNSANYGRHSFTFKDRPVYRSVNQNDSPDDEKFKDARTKLYSSTNYFEILEPRKYSHEYDFPQQRNSAQLLVSPRGVNTMTVGHQVGAAFTDRPNQPLQNLQQPDERSIGIGQYEIPVDQNRFKHMIDQLSPEKVANEDYVNIDHLQRPRANSSPQNFIFSPNKPPNKRSHEYTQDNMNMIIQEEEFSNAEVTDEIQQPKLESYAPTVQSFQNQNVQQMIETAYQLCNEIKEESPQFSKEQCEMGLKKTNSNQLYNVSKSPLIQPSFKQKGRLDEIQSKSIPLNFNQGHHPSFGNAAFQPFQANLQMPSARRSDTFKMPQGMSLQGALSNSGVRYPDISQRREMPLNFDSIGLSLPPSARKVESVESETQTTPQKVSFGISPQEDQEHNQNKFFHSVDKQFFMDQFPQPNAFDYPEPSLPGRPQSVPVCFQQLAHLRFDAEQQLAANFKVNKFQLDGDQKSKPQREYIQNQQVQPHLAAAPGGQQHTLFASSQYEGRSHLNQLISDLNQRANPPQQFYSELQPAAFPYPNQLKEQNTNTISGPANNAYQGFTDAPGQPNQNAEAIAEPEPGHQPTIQPALARSKTVVKNTEHLNVIADRENQPTEATVPLNQNAQLVNFIRITKHEPSRKNMKQQLIFCHNETREDYKFSKYLEQNRYSRLFNEKELLGEGGFGKVYKVEHVLDQRMYAIKQIQIHLGINEDFKKHSVYREIVAISQVQHKNVVRYHACWIESVAPDMKKVDKAVKKLAQSMRQKLKEGKNKKREESNSEESAQDMDLMSKSISPSVQILSSSLKLDNKYSDAIQRKMIENNGQASKGSSICKKTAREDTKKGRNLLGQFNQESDMRLNEDWNHYKGSCGQQSKFKGIHTAKLDLESSEASASLEVKSKDDYEMIKESDPSSSADSSSSSDSDESSSCSEEQSFVQDSDCDSDSGDLDVLESGSDDDTSVDSSGSLYQLIDKEKDFITLNVMIQMEHCIGNTLREFLDNKDYIVNRKMVFHFFKQLINGLKHIHEEGLIHRDIKPANIFIDNARMQLKIGDFGLAKKQNNMKQQLEQEIKGLKRTNLSLANLHQFNSINTIQAKEHLEKQQLKASLIGCKQASADYLAVNAGGENLNKGDNKHRCSLGNESSICAGTPMYQAPEQTMHQIQISKKANETVCLTDKVDMFAAGLLLYELCYNFRTQHQRIQKFHLLRTQRKLPDEIFKNMPEERDIILNLTDPDPKKRSSAHYLVNSKTFQTWSFEVKQ